MLVVMLIGNGDDGQAAVVTTVVDGAHDIWDGDNDGGGGGGGECWVCCCDCCGDKCGNLSSNEYGR